MTERTTPAANTYSNVPFSLGLGAGHIDHTLSRDVWYPSLLGIMFPNLLKVCLFTKALSLCSNELHAPRVVLIISTVDEVPTLVQHVCTQDEKTVNYEQH